MKRHLALAMTALLAAGALPLSAQMPKMTKDDVARLLRIAVMSEWVTAECDKRHADELSGMLLMAANSTLRAADAGDVARFRASVREHVQRFATREEACSSATSYLKSVQ